MRTTGGRLILWPLAAAIIAVAAALSLRPAAAAATPDDAVQATVEARGTAYAGDCAATVSPRDIGKVCSRLVEERDGVRAYLLGRTFSEFTTWVFVGSTGTAFTVVSEAPLCFECQSLEIPWP